MKPAAGPSAEAAGARRQGHGAVERSRREASAENARSSKAGWRLQKGIPEDSTREDLSLVALLYRKY